jgi:anti-sigma regulatory factor (Ser/Thr protein kinase)
MDRAEVTLDGGPASVPVARRFVAQALDAAGAADDGWAAIQVVSELATNAVVHAGTRYVVQVKVEATSVRIEVTDERPFAAATARRFSDETTTGRGLRLVDMLSQAWGVETTEKTKTVWCEIVRVIGEDAPEASPSYEPTVLGRVDYPLSEPMAEGGGQGATLQSWVA